MASDGSKYGGRNEGLAKEPSVQQTSSDCISNFGWSLKFEISFVLGLLANTLKRDRVL